MTLITNTFKTTTNIRNTNQWCLHELITLTWASKRIVKYNKGQHVIVTMRLRHQCRWLTLNIYPYFSQYFRHGFVASKYVITSYKNVPQKYWYFHKYFERLELFQNNELIIFLMIKLWNHCSVRIHALRVHYAHAAANLNSGYSKYAKVVRVHYFCTIALRASRAVLTWAWASRKVGLRERRVDIFSKRVIIFCW